ncbi:family 90 glycosyltransferase [Cryphonectria parasitica EP155]|uniref:Family 90 glycosyltransferase n=1 Tax=Cryphonectria parasitica (strain ATCC 38755 / EP155) TaxID=660469 RepID=A0A9P4Y087_CRYP1|nr:family 90 glycosyltransferase [Cryphonectria parasitica EP155]KAF3764604.1 family 90 glycosyltransferase [Cryphonectria parasitica EP155]
MDGSGRIALACAALLFFQIYGSVDQNRVLERLLLSQFLILFISAVLAFAASFIAKRWAGRKGRFDDDARYRKLEESRTASLPHRPSFRFTWLPLAVCISGRLSLLNWLHTRQQCSHPGVELFLPCLFVIYKIFARARRSSGTRGDDEGLEDEEDDIENDVFQDIAAWFQRSHLTNLSGSLALAGGAYLISLPASNSTVTCPASESRHVVLALQWLGLALDAVLLALLWRILQWARTPTERFMTVGSILSTSAFFTGVVVVMHHRASGQFQFVETYGVDSLYLFAIFGQSIALLFIASTFFSLQPSPLVATGIMTFLCGTYAAWRKIHQVNTYEQPSKAQFLVGVLVMSLGFTFFSIRNGIRHVGLARSFIVFLMLVFLVVATIYSAAVSSVLDRHPIDKLIYATRTEAHRWLVQYARVSESLGVAAREYRDRHNGRKPPPNFDIWYDYATTRDSPIIDHFQQIDDDLQPFWSLKPSHIQEEILKLGAQHGMGIISIKEGIVTNQQSPEAHDEAVMSDLMELIQPFAQHLPDMDLPVNMLDHPRVLPPWSAGTTPRYGEDAQGEGFMWLWEHQHRLGQACPSHSSSRMGFYPQNGHFCSSCANPHSEGQFLNDRVLGWDLCHQPDLLNLHGFFATHQVVRPFGDLVPVFSRAKTQQHRDILIPLARSKDDYNPEAVGQHEKPLLDKTSQLFWRGSIHPERTLPPGLLSAGHQERLSYLANNATPDDYVTVLLAKSADEEKFLYEKAPLPELNRALKLDVGLSDYSNCMIPECEEVKKEFGMKPEDKDGKAEADSRYVMVMDRDDGPSEDLLRVLRSGSVPFVASIFKEWYTERVFPWLHYVPVDIRFHDLYSTLAYFLGLQDKGLVNGRKVPMQSRVDDAKWIAEQGKQWAAQALRREDAEIYMFRLLLEWGRVIDEKRDDLGYESHK